MMKFLTSVQFLLLATISYFCLGSKALNGINLPRPPVDFHCTIHLIRYSTENFLDDDLSIDSIIAQNYNHYNLYIIRTSKLVEVIHPIKPSIHFFEQCVLHVIIDSLYYDEYAYTIPIYFTLGTTMKIGGFPISSYYRLIEASTFFRLLSSLLHEYTFTDFTHYCVNHLQI